MFHIFHKNILPIALNAKAAYTKKDYAQFITELEVLDGTLTKLHLGITSKDYLKIMRTWGGVFESIDHAEQELDKLIHVQQNMRHSFPDAYHNKNYGPAAHDLEELIEILQWFDQNSSEMEHECGEAIVDMTESLREVEHLREILQGL